MKLQELSPSTAGEQAEKRWMAEWEDRDRKIIIMWMCLAVPRLLLLDLSELILLLTLETLFLLLVWSTPYLINEVKEVFYKSYFVLVSKNFANGI